LVTVSHRSAIAVHIGAEVARGQMLEAGEPGPWLGTISPFPYPASAPWRDPQRVLRHRDGIGASAAAVGASEAQTAQRHIAAPAVDDCLQVPARDAGTAGSMVLAVGRRSGGSVVTLMVGSLLGAA
jgi:hypothetical protein